MKPSPKMLTNIAAVLLVGWIMAGKPGLGGHSPAVPVDPPLVVPADAPQLDALFAGAGKMVAERDLTYLVAMLDRLATYIERDGMAPEPRLKHGGQVQDMRGQMRHDLFDGASLTAKYPAFGQTAGAYLDAKVGTVPADLTSDERRKWVEAFRGLSLACERARRAL